ncbi:hypothetical protein ALC57_09343, partial [Trachymyrmex cornetzi]
LSIVSIPSNIQNFLQLGENFASPFNNRLNLTVDLIKCQSCTASSGYASRLQRKTAEGDREKLLECVMSEGVSGNLPESVGRADLYSLTLADTNVRALKQTTDH